MSACSSAPQRQHTKHQWCHQQPRRELRHEHCSHCTVKNSIHSLVAMEALKATSTVAEDDPDLISKIRARCYTRNRLACPLMATPGAVARLRTKTLVLHQKVLHINRLYPVLTDYCDQTVCDMPPSAMSP